MPRLALFHTSETHIARFDALLGELEPGLCVTHEVQAQLLHDARRDGVNESLRQALGLWLSDLAQRADVILCTCSTLGAAAEAFDRCCGARVVRIDRPLARAAVAQAAMSSVTAARGHHIAVVAALASTLEPTRHLLEEEAAEVSRPLTLSWFLAEAAWAHFEQGDTDGYLRAVARTADEAAATADVVVLAQASMAGAERLVQTRKPVLSSPKLGLKAALALL